MYFKYACEHCGKSLKVNEEHAGRKAKCPYCHNTVVVPKAPAPTPPGGGLNDIGLREDSGFETPSDSKPAASDSSTATTETADKTGQKEEKTKQAPAVTEKKPADAPADTGEASQTSGTDVSMVLSALVAVALTIVFYGLVFPLKGVENGRYYWELFYDRGLVPYGITFLMCWSIAILFLKSRKLKRQKESMLFDMLPTELGEQISTENVDRFTQNVRELPVGPQSSFLVNRVLRGLQHFKIRRNSAEVSNMLSSQSEIDSAGVDASYVILGVFLAVIPLLGFVGTVIGISSAVGEFATVLKSADAGIEEMKVGLQGISAGLQTAFDTTLIGLVITILLMLPIRSMQKAEDGLLSWVEEYCNENLLKRLRDEIQVDAGFSQNANEIRKAVNAAMIQHHAELQTWNKKLETIGETVTDQVVGGWTQTHEQMQTKHAENMELINKAVASIAAKQGTSLSQIDDISKMISTIQNDQVKQVDQVAQAIGTQTTEMGSKAVEYQKQMEDSINRITEQLEKMLSDFNQRADSSQQQVTERMEITMQQVSDKTESAQQQMVQAMIETAEAMKSSFSGLEQGLGSLNDVLGKLGEKQVTIEQHVHKHESKGGWFGRKK